MSTQDVEVEIHDNPAYAEELPNHKENPDYFTVEVTAPKVINRPGVTDDPDFDVQTKIDKPKTTKEKWGKRVEYTLNTIGFVVGLGNIWRFSSLCYKYGGAAFITVYTLFYIVIGLPLFILEIYLGQFTSRGCIECWGNCRVLKTIGVGMVTLTTSILFTYAMFVIWSFKYLVLSFFNPLPWSNQSVQYPCNPNCSLSAQIYFWGNGFHVSESTGIGNLGTPKWEIVLAGFFLWLLLFLCLFKGLKITGKTVYFTVLFPYLTAFILLFNGLNLNGSSQGLSDFMSTKNFSYYITNNELWSDAAIQILFSLSLAQGGLTCLASFNELRGNLVMDAVVVTLVDYFSSLLFGIVVFFYVGYVKYGLNLPFDGSGWDGLTLLFIIVPQALSETRLGSLWSVIFFLQLITLAFDVLLTFILTIVMSIYEGIDKIPYLTKVFMNLGICIFGFITTIALSTPGGIYLFQLIKRYGDSWTMLIIALLEIVLIMIFYGGVHIVMDIEFMLQDHNITVKIWKKFTKYYCLACWYCATPICLVYLLISKWITLNAPFTVFNLDYPPWSIFFGWIIALCVPASVIITCIVYLVKAKGTIETRLKFIANCKPSEPLWSIATPADMEKLIEFKERKNEKK